MCLIQGSLHSHACASKVSTVLCCSSCESHSLTQPYTGPPMMPQVVVNTCRLDIWINEQTDCPRKYVLVHYSGKCGIKRTTWASHDMEEKALRSPHLAVLPWSAVLCGSVSCNKDWVLTTQHESDFTYGKAIWDLDLIEGDERREVSGITTLLES